MFVCSFVVRRRGNADIQRSSMLKPVMKWNASHRPFFVTLYFPFTVQMSWFLFISDHIFVHTDFYINVCPRIKLPCMHLQWTGWDVGAKITFFSERQVLNEVQKGASCSRVVFFFFFGHVWENVCLHALQEIAHFSSFLDDCSCFVLFFHCVNTFTAFVKLFLSWSSVQIGVKVKTYQN